MNFKKQIFKMLFTKRQRAIIWQAVLFSEHTYRRRGNVNGAATVQTVINETEKTFGFDKRHFTKEEVDNIVAGVLNDGKAHLEEAFRKGSEVAEEKIKEAYNAGFKRCLDEIEKRAAEKEDNESEDNGAKHVKLHISEIDLSGCKDKKEALEKAIGIIAADLIGSEKSDDKEDNGEKSNEGSKEDADDKEQADGQSEDKTQEEDDKPEDDKEEKC